MSLTKVKSRLDWIDGLKAFALIGILLNHFVESFGVFPWFSYPSYNWPDFATRLSTIFPSDGSLLWRVIQFMGWLGDMGPGVFILVSGFSLTLSALSKNEKEYSLGTFYRKRLLRIFPIYLVIHILVMVGGLLLGNRNIELTSPNVFLSMLGLRFTDGLFFFINPSWWFIGLILQLYFVFPFLYKLLIKIDLKKFILITIGFTILSRAAGLLHITYSDNLMYWMMGSFFGTRLFEFALGMIFAKLLIENKINPANFRLSLLLPSSIVIYISGFIFSLFYLTTLISSSVITLGLCGLFLVLWKVIETYLPLLKPTVKWIGIVSFPVFLIHQPFMIWLGAEYTGLEKSIILFSVIILSFPVGWILEWVVNRVILKLPVIGSRIVTSVIILFLSLQVSLNILYFFINYTSIYKLEVLLFITNIFFIPLFFMLGNKIQNKTLQSILYVFIPTSFLFCFILTPNWFGIFWIVILIMIAGVLLLSLLTKKLIIRVTLPMILVLFIILTVELYLRKNHPVEVLGWGEFPALQKDPLTVYSLIPDKETHLRYNNYDYFVRTNSLGFNGPEIGISNTDTLEYRILIIGDAFTMPEGMEFDKAYPQLLQANLSKRFPLKKIKVFNAGVTGFGPNEMLAQLNKYIDIIKPDLYINEIFINEFEEINQDSTARYSSLRFSKLSVRKEFLGNFQVPKQLSFSIHKSLKDNVYYTIAYNKSLACFYEKKSDLYTPENILKLNAYFASVKSLCDRKKCKVITLFAPGQLEISAPSDIEYYPYHSSLLDSSKFDLNLPKNIFKRLCNDSGIIFLDPTEKLKSNKNQPVYFRESWHWNQEGHKVVASYLDHEITNQITFN